MSKKEIYPALPEFKHYSNYLFNIRGTNGSGKSTVAKIIMGDAIMKDVIEEGPKSRVYRCEMEYGAVVYFIGAYETACGGLDTIASFDEVKRLALKYIELGDVIMEGILWSTVFKSSYELDAQLREMGHSMFWLQLNTPIKTCIDRVMSRRVCNNNFKEFDPSGVLAKQTSISRTFNRAVDVGAIGYVGNGDEMVEYIREVFNGDYVAQQCPHFIDDTIAECKANLVPIKPDEPEPTVSGLFSFS